MRVITRSLVVLGLIGLSTAIGGVALAGNGYSAKQSVIAAGILTSNGKVSGARTGVSIAFDSTGDTLYEAFTECGLIFWGKSTVTTAPSCAKGTAGGWNEISGAHSKFAPSIAIGPYGNPWISWTDKSTGDVMLSSFLGGMEAVHNGSYIGRSSAAPSLCGTSNGLYVAYRGKSGEGVWVAANPAGIAQDWSNQVQVPDGATTALSPSLDCFGILSWTVPFASGKTVAGVDALAFSPPNTYSQLSASDFSKFCTGTTRVPGSSTSYGPASVSDLSPPPGLTSGPGVAWTNLSGEIAGDGIPFEVQGTCNGWGQGNSGNSGTLPAARTAGSPTATINATVFPAVAIWGYTGRSTVKLFNLKITEAATL